MLSKEEKEAIEILKKLQKKTPYIIWGDGTPYNKNNQIQTILNLIEKQQKEIEELKQNRDEYKEEYKKLLNARYYDYISKDKIREWLDRFELEEDLQEKYDELLGSDAIYKFLKKLLEEN